MLTTMMPQKLYKMKLKENITIAGKGNDSKENILKTITFNSSKL